MTPSSPWKIDNARLRVIVDLDKVIKEMEIPYLLVGAAARDLLDDVAGVSSTRMTKDIDIAIMVESWQAFDRLKVKLLKTGKFTRNNEDGPRFYHHPTNLPVDIIPFGQLDGVKHSISWPPKNEHGMSTLGFNEAYDNSIEMRVSEEKEVLINVPSRAGLAIMKLIAWDENPARAKDALDLLHLIRNYLISSDESRLYNGHADLIETDDFDYECAAARLMGRDMASIASQQALIEIDRILTLETNDDSDYRLISDMLGIGTEREYHFDEVLRLIVNLKKGIKDIIRNNK
jgi:predicted nucleotidyltransferase